ncbi:myelin-associated glycoprotein-like [Trichomycterus rosablanca]|uniref:myelin-associated glycoprotein-like n=1 Tax=Trichomycterus rosablanca TaxID=2290929 RepID=UPI002F35A2D5
MEAAVKFIITSLFLQAVLCQKFSIDLPQKVEALSGSCVLLPCTFQIEEKYNTNLQNNLTGIWKKVNINPYTEVFNSKQTKNQIKGEMRGDLKQKNCTTIFYNISESNIGNYMFRIEETGALKWDFTEGIVSIVVRSNLTSPSVTLYKENQMEEQKEVLEGTSVSLFCSAPSSCPNVPNFTWSFLPEEKILKQNQNITFSSSTLKFRASHLHHGLNITCNITYQLENKNIRSAQSSFALHVLYAPKNTTLKVSPSAQVLLGSSVNLSCSSDANPAVLNYTWYRKNGEQIGTGNHLIINKTDETHHGLYCRAQNQHGDQNSSSYLDLQYAPQISFSSSCNTNQTSIQCFCVVHGYPSPKLEWRLSDQTLPNESTIQESVSNVTLNSSISVRLPQTKATPILQCVGTNHLGVATQIFSFIGGAQVPNSSAASGLSLDSLLIGVAVGAAAVGVLCVLGLCISLIKLPPVLYSLRKSQQRASQSGAGAAGLVLNDKVPQAVLCQEYDSDSLYANKTVSSDSLHYSSINFPNGSGTQIRGLSTLTEEYATVQNHPDQGAAKPEPLAKTGTKNQVNMDRKESPEEEATYGNIVRHQKTDPACPGLDVVAGIQDEQKNGSDPDQLEHSDAPEGLYAQVKPLPKV